MKPYWPAHRLLAGPLAGGGAILVYLQRFFLAYSGVFALLALTAAVAAGLLATDRLVISPAGRVIFQAVHRALSLAAVGFLASHVVLEILAHRSRAIDTVVPFVATGRALYLGLGTLASDLVLLIVLTGVARRRFATRWTGAWRAIHLTAYLGWPLAILHGLLGGRPAKPYVGWSYGGCVAAAALALVIRLVATIRSRTDAVPHPVPDRAAQGSPAAMSVAGQPPPHRALPGGAHPGTVRYGIVDDRMPGGP
jgi:DMSO/TMAO reductase YedYZ heme-binding membrane subunit